MKFVCLLVVGHSEEWLKEALWEAMVLEGVSHGSMMLGLTSLGLRFVVRLSADEMIVKFAHSDFVLVV